MKKAIFIISIITLFFVGCKKFDKIEASKVEIVEEKIEKGWDYIKIYVEYDYPVDLEAVTLYLSEKEDMSGAKAYECKVEGNKFSVEVEGLKEGAAYYYCYEYDNGYEEEKCGKKSMQTISKPVVVTDAATNVTSTTAVLKGSVTNNDSGNKITEMGLCWGTEHEPTIEGEHYNKGIGNAEGTTTFTYNLVNLQDNVTYYFRSYVVTNFGIVYGEEKSFTTVEIVLPTVTTNTVTNITTNSATCGGNVTFDGNATVTARGVCWSTKPNPTISDSKTTDGSGTGSYTSNLSNLASQTTYYVRAYATNEVGTAYGEEKSFTTVEIVLPTVTTNAVTNITTNSASCGGNVTFNGNATVTARGICWSTSPNPTIEKDNKTNNGSGTGSFTSYMSGLKDGTTYYVRAYATNEKGTSYGEEKTFTTVEIVLPTVTTNTVTNITTNSATCGGNVTFDGNATVTARGVCWSTSPNPTVEDNKTNNGSGTGSFTSYMSGLKDGTTYYVRAYATNEVGTAYGEEKSFTTVEIVLPTVTTNTVTNIKVTTATCGGIVTSDGNSMVTSRGICWSTSQNPTINDNKITEGSGIGNFTSNLSNLAPQTTYYVRAYATNEKGTSYGEQKSFTTLDKYNGHEYVDLGLPSGLLWATCNVGATSPEEYGNYYAWGETTTKSDYSSSNCPTYWLSISQLQSQGYIDSEGKLSPQYDAATANWGGNWRMPTKAEQEELLNNCTWTWTTQNGVNGYNVEGPNGNSIFLPAAGNRHGSSLDNAGSYGCYWSSTPNDDDGDYYVYGLGVYGYQYVVGYSRRNYGFSVRPVVE